MKKISKLLTYYSFITVSLMVITSFLNAQDLAQVIVAVFFYPLAVYFWLSVFPRKQQALVLIKKNQILKAGNGKKIKSTKAEIIEGEIVKPEESDIDSNRRMFLKLIGSAGASVFFFSLFTKKAEAAFFGSVPGPGTVAVKNIAGEKIDPSEKQPTDGYRIARIDDSTPAYYGYVNKDGGWFIMREEADGTYKYARGASGFLANGWGIRNTTLEYDDFDEVF